VSKIPRKISRRAGVLFCYRKYRKCPRDEKYRLLHGKFVFRSLFLVRSTIPSFQKIPSPPTSCPLPQGQQQSLLLLKATPLLLSASSSSSHDDALNRNHPPRRTDKQQHQSPFRRRRRQLHNDNDKSSSVVASISTTTALQTNKRRSSEFCQLDNDTMKSPTQVSLADEEDVDENDSPSSTTTNMRTLDSYLEDAYNYHTEDEHDRACGTSVMRWLPLQKWRYWAVMLSLGVANSSDASEILCLSYILSDSNFEDTILQGTQWRAGLLASAVFLGMLVGGLLVGTLGDFMGRRPMLLVGLVFNSVAGLLSAVTTNVWQLSFIRTLAGLGIGATVPPLFTLVTELAPPTRRGFFVTLCASFWMVGSIYVALAALAILQWWNLSWRIFAVACAVPSAAGAILVALLVPESPRFCALHGNPHEAVRIANLLATKMSFVDGPPLSLPEVLSQFPLRQPLTDGLVMTTSSSSTSPSYSWHWLCHVMKLAWSDFCQSTLTLYTPHLKRTTFPLQLVWFSLNFGTYGILTWINTLFKVVHLENIYYNALLFALANLPGNILSATLMDRMGRSTMLVGSSLAAATSLLSFAFFASAELSSSSSSSTSTPGSHLGESNNTDSGRLLLERLLESSTAATYSTIGIVASACAFQCFSIAAWNTIDCMTSELFPTPVRSTGMGVCAASGRMGAMVAQFVNGALVSNPVRLLLVASSSLVLSAMTPCLLPAGGDLTGQPVHDVVEHRPLDRSSSASIRGSIRSLLPQGGGVLTPNGLPMEVVDVVEHATVSNTTSVGSSSSSGGASATPYMRVKNNPPSSTYQHQS
jgi:MFS family permease